MPNEDEDRVALIDLDGTVADYDTAMRDAMRAIQHPTEPPYGHRFPESEEPTYVEARRKMIQRKTGFWSDLKPIPLGMSVIEEMNVIGFELHVLTKGPAKTNNAWTEKKEWCDEHLPGIDVTITAKKSLSYGRVLFDDFPPYFESWIRHRPRGLVICLAHPWNEEYARGGPKENPNILRFDGSMGTVVDLQKKLRRAYERKTGETL